MTVISVLDGFDITDVSLLTLSKLCTLKHFCIVRADSACVHKMKSYSKYLLIKSCLMTLKIQ